jgi:hypothetical protein
MIRRATQLLVPVATLVALALLLPALAQASPQQVVRDCAEDGVVDGDYSNEEKRKALRQIPADLDEYSDCRAIIRGSISSPGGGPTGGRVPIDSDGDGSFDSSAPPVTGSFDSGSTAPPVDDGGGAPAPSRSDDGVQEQVTRVTADPVIAGLFDRASTTNGLPLPVLLALIALALLAVAGSLASLRQRRPAFFTTLGQRRPKFLDGALRRVPRFRRRG